MCHADFRLKDGGKGTLKSPPQWNETYPMSVPKVVI